VVRCRCVFADEQRLLGSRGANLILYDIAGGRTIPLTKDGEPDTIDNGRARWSPDGRWIAYVQSDFSAVRNGLFWCPAIRPIGLFGDAI